MRAGPVRMATARVLAVAKRVLAGPRAMPARPNAGPLAIAPPVAWVVLLCLTSKQAPRSVARPAAVARCRSEAPFVLLVMETAQLRRTIETDARPDSTRSRTAARAGMFVAPRPMRLHPATRLGSADSVVTRASWEHSVSYRGLHHSARRPPLMPLVQTGTSWLAYWEGRQRAGQRRPVSRNCRRLASRWIKA